MNVTNEQFKRAVWQMGEVYASSLNEELKSSTYLKILNALKESTHTHPAAPAGRTARTAPDAAADDTGIKATIKKHNNRSVFVKDAHMDLCRIKNNGIYIYTRYDSQIDKLCLCSENEIVILNHSGAATLFNSPNAFGCHDRPNGVNALVAVEVRTRVNGIQDEWLTLGNHLVRHFGQPDNENT